MLFYCLFIGFSFTHVMFCQGDHQNIVTSHKDDQYVKYVFAYKDTHITYLKPTMMFNHFSNALMDELVLDMVAFDTIT